MHSMRSPPASRPPPCVGLCGPLPCPAAPTRARRSAFEFAGAQGIDARHGLAATLVLATAGLATPVAINSFPVVMGARDWRATLPACAPASTRVCVATIRLSTWR
jgi:hypothetical protein